MLQQSNIRDAKQRELDSYKAEVYKSLQGQGRFEPELPNELIVSSRAEVESLVAQAEAHRSELADLQSDAMRIQKDYDTMISWANLYVTASRERKKMILYQLIHKVRLGGIIKSM